MSAREWTLIIDWLGRPTLANKVHNMHYRAVSADRKRWREAGCQAARLAKVRPCDAVTLECWGRYPSGRLPDADAVAPSLKGVIDGLVDAAVVTDDDGTRVRAITYRAPVVTRGLPAALVVVITECAPVSAPTEE